MQFGDSFCTGEARSVTIFSDVAYLVIMFCSYITRLLFIIPPFMTYLSRPCCMLFQVAKETNEELRSVKAEPAEGFDIGAVLVIARR